MAYIRGTLLEGLLVVIGLTLPQVNPISWNAFGCPSELLEFERRSCLPEGNEDQSPGFHTDCEELGCTYCTAGVTGVPECFNNTRPGFFWYPPTGIMTPCETDIPDEDRVQCLPFFTRDDYFSNAMCVALGCQWCLNTRPYCFYRNTVGVRKPVVRVAEIRNIGTYYIAKMTRPALRRDEPAKPIESWFIDMTFSNPVKELKIGDVEVQSVDPEENRHFIIRPLTLDHWDPYLEANYLITARLDKQAANYTPVANGRLFYDSPPSLEFVDLFSTQEISMRKVMERGCLTSFEFDPEVTSASSGLSVVEYSFNLEQSDVSNFTLVIPKDYTTILSEEFAEAPSRVYLTRYYQLVTMQLNGLATPRSGSFTMLMLYDSALLERELDPEFAWMQVDGEPSSVCKVDSPVPPEEP